jgi:hypothetical protein
MEYSVPFVVFHIRALKNILYQYKKVYPVAVFSSQTCDLSILFACLYIVFICE